MNYSVEAGSVKARVPVSLSGINWLNGLLIIYDWKL